MLKPTFLFLYNKPIKLKDSKMKKVFTLCVAIMVSAATFAQTTLWNGENCAENTDGGFWNRCNRRVVVNPQKDGVNPSEKCLQFKITSNEWENGSAAIGLDNPFFRKQAYILNDKEGREQQCKN